MTIPIVMTASGVQPQSPSTLRDELVAEATALAPGLTTELPGSLVEDMASTGAGALVVCDKAVIESVNNVTPLGANLFVLNTLGTIYGTAPGVSANTSVYVVFTGTVGFIINPGFTVSDGSNQYVIQDGGIIESGGSSSPLYCVASSSGTWAVPAGTVTSIVTSVPGTITLSVTNPTAGTPATGEESPETYRARVLTAGKATAQGLPSFLRKQLQNITGVQTRLVSVRQANGGYQVIVGGGDPYAIAGAIYKGIFDLNNLVGSVLDISDITQANPGVVTTILNHGYATGQTVTISGSDPVDYDGSYTVTVIDEKSFSIATDTTGFPAYVGDAIAEPNNRNQTVTVTDYPDTYDITFVVPPLQTVTVELSWDTSTTNVVSSTSIAQVSAPAIASYINSVPVGQPINVFELQNAFEVAIADVIPAAYITKMDFTVSINGIVTAPDAGTGIINGDPESYFYSESSDITVTRVP